VEDALESIWCRNSSAVYLIEATEEESIRNRIVEADCNSVVKATVLHS